jgi:hypothetical protein
VYVDRQIARVHSLRRSLRNPPNSAAHVLFPENHSSGILRKKKKSDAFLSGKQKVGRIREFSRNKSVDSANSTRTMASSSFLSSIPRQTLIAVGCATVSVAFIGYCVYFDRKRRSAPDFKEKLRESWFLF